ncbi:lactoylglutathione lyase (plasmid) [Sphingomonas paeninsulae]|uniref:Aldoketomutase n=1 Tax=Sphingomonas paeninsulae TaxID=2319844 RepID=A0A494T6J7_SPHPE|nr:lactoylglutathione lyase [Sphingomonas paeninsulae]AYJ84967.1 lactoylglutathione lyase [Sphingomonas paeninsulae]
MSAQLSSNRFLHTMCRVEDLDRSLVFYCDGLGMTVNRRLDFQEARFSLIYLGYIDDNIGTVLELTWNWDDSEKYTHGSGYGHIGIGVDDLEATCARIRQVGGAVVREPGEMMNSGIEIAFITDPDGYQIELIKNPFPKPWMEGTTTL